MLRRLTSLLAAAALMGLAASANAALKPGDAAPLFTTDAAVGGKQMPLVLADALRKGPVVLYFFPKSFTSGCTLEAHMFAEATDKFAVAADPQSAIIKSYDAKMIAMPFSDRISYVITPDDKILFAYSAMDPAEHVNKTMKAISDWRATHPQ